MKRYKTQSGGSYLVDEEAKLIRMESRGPKNTSKRLTGEWQSYDRLVVSGGLVIIWGLGQDEHTIYPDLATGRATKTSLITSVEEVERN